MSYQSYPSNRSNRSNPTTFAEEHRKFREDDSHEIDDQVDAASDAFNELAAPSAAMVSQSGLGQSGFASQYSRLNAGREEDEDDDDEGEF